MIKICCVMTAMADCLGLRVLGETLGFVLNFLYVDAVDIEASNAEALYIAGQNYQLPRLSGLAEAFLESQAPLLALLLSCGAYAIAP